ncbi:hypothetical protein [Pontibacter sp. G13]|uniref:hypothetical protein n=1 Tax=Pontibacter sp. G13 TaxID=3074898 RepID=UPI0028898C73|nr:hypothetical protein [Pontibacter sp. G13]WNJ16094.1 hypothetical protein RJD25_14620 [Pontibacter sp. G13]
METTSTSNPTIGKPKRKSYVPKLTSTLSQEISDHTGIILEGYQSDELAGKISDLIFFPLYVLKWIGYSILGMIGLDIALIYFEDAWTMIIIYLTLGMALALINGLLVGMLVLIWRIRSDVQAIMRLSLELTAQVMDDYRKKSTKGKVALAFQQVFRAVVFVVIVPLATQSIAKRLPVMGGIFSRIFVGIIGLTVKKSNQLVETAYLKEPQNLPETQSTASEMEAEELRSETSHKIERGFSKVIGVSTRIVALPIWLIFGLVLTLSILLLSMFNAILG